MHGRLCMRAQVTDVVIRTNTGWNDTQGGAVHLLARPSAALHARQHFHTWSVDHVSAHNFATTTMGPGAGPVPGLGFPCPHMAQLPQRNGVYHLTCLASVLALLVVDSSTLQSAAIHGVCGLCSQAGTTGRVLAVRVSICMLTHCLR